MPVTFCRVHSFEMVRKLDSVVEGLTPVSNISSDTKGAGVEY